MGYDVIGDIHGQAGKLRALLRKLGYRPRSGAYRHPQGRTAVFLGDLIDRGPEQVETVSIVRHMVDAGTGRCVMGNHEFNAIGFATLDPDRPGEYLRPRSAKNTGQHAEFLRQVGLDSQRHEELVAWFRTLPPCLELDGIRAVHAWWNRDYVQKVGGGTLLSPSLLTAAFRKGTQESAALDGLLKGMEIELPEGCRFVDRCGIERSQARVRWWLDNPGTYREAAIAEECEGDSTLDERLPPGLWTHTWSEKPVFVGHYWLTGTPQALTPTVACLDFSAGGNGPLVGYRWDGESELAISGFVAAEDTLPSLAAAPRLERGARG